LKSKLLIVVFLLSCAQASAQVFPVQGSVTLTPPYSPYLTNLTAPGSQRLMLNLRVNDPSLNDYTCKLRITIDGVGITLRTRPSFVPQPITLPGGGIPQVLYGEDIADYFNPVNLDFAGISRRDFEKTNRLPEGVYRFSIEVLDNNRGTVVSNKFFATAWVILNDPPLLNLPRHATKVSILDPTNIAFTWTPRHTASVNAAFSTEYVFKLVELQASSPELQASSSQLLTVANQALLSQPPLFELVTDQSSLVYSPGEPALIPGRLYAWQVQAKDIEGSDLFKNSGKSEAFIFQFGDALGVPQNLGSDDRNANVIMLHWDAPIQGDMPEYYRIQYRPEFSDKWYDVRSRPNQRWHNVTDLKPDTKYVLRVRSEKGKQASEYSAPLIVSTAKEGEDYQCGAPSTPPVITSSGPVFKLFPGDTITMAKFPVIIIDVKGGNGFFEGTGWMIVKPFHGARTRIKFNGKINNDHQLDGLWETISTGQSEIGNFLETLEKIGEDRRKALLEESDSALNAQPVSPAIPITIVGVIETMVVNGEGKIVITKEDGSTETITQPVNEQTKAKETIVITDASGTQYRVETKDGKTSVTKVQGGAAGGTGNATAQRKLDQMILASLNKFKKAIEDYWAANNITPPKGKGPYDGEWEVIAELPVCLDSHRDKLPGIHAVLETYSKNEATVAEFRKRAIEPLIKAEFPTEQTQDNAPPDKIEAATCEAVKQEAAQNEVNKASMIPVKFDDCSDCNLWQTPSGQLFYAARTDYVFNEGDQLLYDKLDVVYYILKDGVKYQWNVYLEAYYNEEGVRYANDNSSWYDGITLGLGEVGKDMLDPKTYKEAAKTTLKLGFATVLGGTSAADAGVGLGPEEYRRLYTQMLEWEGENWIKFFTKITYGAVSSYGASVLIAANGTKWVRVGSWMSRTEYDAMLKAMKTQPRNGNMHHVLLKGREGFRKQAKPGWVYVEYDIPADTFIGVGGEDGWGILFSEESVMGKLYIKNGKTNVRLPEVKNIILLEEK
jgi:hypothetical protein